MYLIWTWFNGFDLQGVYDQIYKSLDKASLIQQLICVRVWFNGCDRFGLWPCMDKLRRSHFDPITEMFGSLIRQRGLVWAPARYVWAYIRLWSSSWDLFWKFDSMVKIDLREKKFVQERGWDNCKMFNPHVQPSLDKVNNVTWVLKGTTPNNKWPKKVWVPKTSFWFLFIWTKGYREWFWIMFAQDTWPEMTHYSQALPKSMEEMSHLETTQKEK